MGRTSLSLQQHGGGGSAGGHGQNRQASLARRGGKPPNISSKFWAVYDVSKQNILGGRREYQKREVASLTKIMTCHVVLTLCKQWNLSVTKTKIFVSDIASDIRGTSACL